MATSDQASVQSRMEALLGVEEGEPAPEVVPPTPDVEEEERRPQSDAEAADAAEAAKEGEDAPPETETKEQRTLRLKHDGQEIEKPEDEVIALAQQGFDYTQKTQKLADERKAVEDLAQTLKSQEQNFAAQMQVQQALHQDIAKVTAIDSQLSQYQNLDWQSLSNTDPVEAQKLFFAYTQLKTQRDQSLAEVQKKQQEFSQAQAKFRSQQVELGRKALEKDIPGWGPELAKSLVAAGKEYGFKDEELANLTDPRAVKLLHDAAQWRKFQSEKPTTDKKVAAASPAVKPGAKDNNNAVKATMKADREALRKTGKADYATKLIERML